jgi:lysophospholipase L1-like esterase
MALLDSIASVIAWDLKKLRAAYAGACIRVRRADATELDIGFDGNGNLDWAAAAAHSATLTVVKIYDQSGNANHLVTTDAGTQAILDQTNKRIAFDGSQMRYQTTNAIDLSAVGAVSVFARFQQTGSSGTRTIAEFSTNWNSVAGNFHLYTAAANLEGGATSGVGAYNYKQKSIDTALHTASLIVDKSLSGAAISAMRVDGSTSGVTSPEVGAVDSTFGNHTLFIGSRNSLAQFFNGSMTGLIVCASAVSNTDRDAIEASIGVQNGGGGGGGGAPVISTFTATKNTAGTQASLAWTATNTPTGYTLTEAVNGGSAVALFTNTLPSQPYLRTIAPGNSYVYSLVAINGVGSSSADTETVISTLRELAIGDSLTEGVSNNVVGGSSSTNAYPHKVAVAIGLDKANSYKHAYNGYVIPENQYLVNAYDSNKPITVENHGVGGKRIDQMTADFDAYVLAEDQNYNSNWVTFMGGANDAFQGASGQTIYDRIKAFEALCQTNGIKFRLLSGTASTQASIQSGILAANALMRADNSFADAFVDLGRNTVFLDPTNATYYDPDGTHLTPAGYQKIADLVQMSRLGTLTYPVITTASLPNGTVSAAYSQTLAATNSPTSWQHVSGTLPPGLPFNTSTGAITGTPTTAGTYSNLVFRAARTDGNFDEKTLSITINPAGGDVIDPTGSITSPTAAQVVSGTIPITATANDNVAVGSVQLKVDGVNHGPLKTVAPYTHSLDTTLLTNGAHTASAVVTDTSGNDIDTAVANFTVNNAAVELNNAIKIAFPTITDPAPDGFKFRVALNQAMATPIAGETAVEAVDVGDVEETYFTPPVDGMTYWFQYQSYRIIGGAKQTLGWSSAVSFPFEE